MQQTLFELDEAVSKKVELDEKETWMNDAYLILKKYLENMNHKFMCEDVQKFADESFKFRQPKDKRWWGNIMVKAKDDGLIVKRGFAAVNNPLGHQHPAGVWERI